MSVTVVNALTPTTLQDLREAVDVMIETAASEGHTSDTVYLNLGSMTLERQTLSDGSCVFNAAFQIIE